MEAWMATTREKGVYSEGDEVRGAPLGKTDIE